MKAKLPRRKQQKIKQQSSQEEQEEAKFQEQASQEEIVLFPRMLKKDALFVTFNGCIQQGYFDEFRSLTLYIGFLAGSDWKVLSGKKQGVTQVGATKDQSIVWNYPFQITYETTNLAGWPQLIIIAYGTDFFGKSTVKGYGNIFLSSSGKTHKRKIRMFCPLPQSTLSGLLGYIQGCIAEYRNVQKTLVLGDGREVTRTKSIGTIQMKIQTIRYNFEKFGYQ